MEPPPKKIEGVAMAAYLLPPTSTPKLGLNMPIQLAVSQRKRWRRKSPFGAPLEDYAMAECYGFRAPQVLVALWCGMVGGGGLFCEGIFRLAPDASESAAVERLLLKGRLEKGHPVVLAHLIKKFLRELPGGLLGSAPTATIRSCGAASTGVGCSQGAKDQLVESLSPSAAHTLQWLVRIISLTQECRGRNKMNLRNLALVIAPNLFGPAAGSNANPIEELQRVEVATNALHSLVSAVLSETDS